MDQTFDNDRIVKINIEEEIQTRTPPHPVWYDGH